MNRITAPLQRYVEVALKRSRLCDFKRSDLLASRKETATCFHTSTTCLAKQKKELSSEPTKFTSSAANTRTMPAVAEYKNPYQPLIVSISLFVFMIYFLLLREENDLDDALNVGLFERVPHIEEPHLMQAIPRMKDAGIDTREAELRLKELREARLTKEALAKGV